MKPGNETSEWKVTVVTALTSLAVALLSLLALFGYITQAQADQLLPIVSMCIISVVSLYTASRVTTNYENGRRDQKMASLMNASPEQLEK